MLHLQVESTAVREARKGRRRYIVVGIKTVLLRIPRTEPQPKENVADDVAALAHGTADSREVKKGVGSNRLSVEDNYRTKHHKRKCEIRRPIPCTFVNDASHRGRLPLPPFGLALLICLIPGPFEIFSLAEYFHSTHQPPQTPTLNPASLLDDADTHRILTASSNTSTHFCCVYTPFTSRVARPTRLCTLQRRQPA
jgi:hypothetical protein